jgi:nicotinamide riboside kinase
MGEGNIVNCFGGPGSGKSTLAARLYTELKQQHVEVEYVNEYPKQLVYEENIMSLQNQILVFATQYHRIWTAARHNQIVITDSPLMLSTVYHPDTGENFHRLIVETHEKFNNLNIMLRRFPEHHSMVGRIHSLTESISLDNRIRHVLEQHDMDYLEFDSSASDNIPPLLQLIKQELL